MENCFRCGSVKCAGISQKCRLLWLEHPIQDDPEGEQRKESVLVAEDGVERVVVSTLSRRRHWTIKKSEGQRTDAFELWCWSRPLKAP